MTDNKFFEAIKIFNDMKIEYCIGGSTLLSILLDGQIWEHDREADFFIHSYDLEKFRNNILVSRYLPSVTGGGAIGLKDDTISVTGVIDYGDFEITNVSDDFFSVYEKETIFPSKPLEYKGVIIQRMNDYDKGFTSYYGKNWKTKQPNWTWSSSKNIIHASSIDEAIKSSREGLC
jgi:hypothetical protein